MFKFQKTILATLCILAACAEPSGRSSGAFGGDVARSSNGAVSNPSGFSRSVSGSERNAVSHGTDEFLNTEAFASSGRGRAEFTVRDKGLVELTLANASVQAAAEAILSGVLDMPFTIADGVSGNITVQSTGPIPKSVLLDLFNASLSANGARLEISNNMAKILAGSSGNRTFRSINSAGIDGSTIVVAPLKFISPLQMVELLEPLQKDGLEIVPDVDRNLLLLSGSKGALVGAIDALNLFDVDVMKGKSIALVSLDAADPNDVVSELMAIFESQEGGTLGGVIDFIPNQRLGSVLVVTSRARYLNEARRWISELDRTAGKLQRYTKVYPLHNRRASEIAPILDGLMSAVAPAVDGQDGAPTQTQETSRIAADPERNSLVVRGLQSEHEEVSRLLVDLDSRANQVALEATIAEVTLNDEVDLGVRWFMEKNARQTGFSNTNSGSPSQDFPGFSALFSAGNSQIVLNALSAVTDVKVISSPTLVVMDNKEAILQIGDQVPIATRSSASTGDAGAPVVTNIDYRDTGVILKVLPQIGASGTLSLDVSQEVSSVATTNTSGIDSPTIRQRQISTSVILNDGATLILGGLVQESDNLTQSAVPGLGDIPFLGTAFRSRDSRKARTELLILIRPRIIRNAGDASEFTSEWRSKLVEANAITLGGLGAPKHSIEELFR